MARYSKLTLKAYINVAGDNKLWYEIDVNGTVTWYLPKELTAPYQEQMLKNIGENMSRYMENNLESPLWN